MLFVIDILPASRRVPADSLQHPARSSVDRYVGPGWWDCERVNSGEIGAIDGAAVRAGIAEPLLSESQDARLLQSFKVSHNLQQSIRIPHDCVRLA